ncbi:dihydrofolate synthase/folylpolyglutamate synthase [Desulfitispora alkaliphila]|uniref:bifunctional folylpolyglutamate synthase/dihydrofolate synthase n=1 Tax=Desulfitispora alkaliphila TaxID=622674 RepID=UPI003D1F0F6E
MFTKVEEVVDFVYKSYNVTSPEAKSGKDELTRNPEFTKQLLSMLGSPQSGMRVVTVAGSKGKGSTSRMIAKLLEDHGLTVGLFTSPHLVDFRERIRINGVSISEKDLLRLGNLVKPSALKIIEQLENNEYLGPVGISLAIACQYFREQGAQVIVLECGRGGMYDDVSVVKNQWAVITPIMKEHTKKLGKSLHEIATNKAGIIGFETERVLVAKQADEAKVAINARIEQIGAKAGFLEQNFYSKIEEVTEMGIVFSVKSKNSYDRIVIPSLAQYQVENGAVAIATAEEVLREFGILLEEGSLKKSFDDFFWPGRCQLINLTPKVLVDGAVTKESAEHLKNVLLRTGIKPIVSIVGVPEDKEYQEVFKHLCSISHLVIATESIGAQNPFPSNVLDIVQNIHPNAVWEKDVTTAIERAKSEIGTSGIICIAGTQSLVGAALKYYGFNLDRLEEK